MKLTQSRWLIIHTVHLSWLVAQAKGAPQGISDWFGCGKASPNTAHNPRESKVEGLTENLLPYKQLSEIPWETSEVLSGNSFAQRLNPESRKYQKTQVDALSDQGQGAKSIDAAKLSGSNGNGEGEHQLHSPSTGESDEGSFSESDISNSAGQYYLGAGPDSEFNRLVGQLEKALEELESRGKSTFSQLVQREKIAPIIEKCKLPIWTGELDSWKEGLKTGLSQLNAFIVPPGRHQVNDMIKLLESVPPEQHFRDKQYQLYQAVIKMLDEHQQKVDEYNKKLAKDRQKKISKLFRRSFSSC